MNSTLARILEKILEDFRRPIRHERFFKLLIAAVIFIGSIGWAVAKFWFDIPNYIIQERFTDIFPLFLGLLGSIGMTAIALSGADEGVNSKKQPERLLSEYVNKKTETIEDVFTALRARMLLDAERLQQNSFKNLAIGIIFSTFAFILLVWFVYSYNDAAAPSDGRYEFFVRWFLPRVSVVLLLQFVGFFFLRLYVVSESDIKHNKNEITNIEAKVLAYYMAKQAGDPLLKAVVVELSKTERNFILKKNEKTIGFENDPNDSFKNDLINQLLDKLPSLKRTRTAPEDIA